MWMTKLKVDEIIRELEKKDQTVGKTNNNLSDTAQTEEESKGKKIIIALPVRKGHLLQVTQGI